MQHDVAGGLLTQKMQVIENETGLKLVAIFEQYVAQERALGFDAGFQLGAKTENSIAKRAVVGALLDIMGKDTADGVIDLGAAGNWVNTTDKGVVQF